MWVLGPPCPEFCPQTAQTGMVSKRLCIFAPIGKLQSDLLQLLLVNKVFNSRHQSSLSTCCILLHNFILSFLYFFFIQTLYFLSIEVRKVKTSFHKWNDVFIVTLMTQVSYWKRHSSFNVLTKIINNNKKLPLIRHNGFSLAFPSCEILN